MAKRYLRFRGDESIRALQQAHGIVALDGQLGANGGSGALAPTLICYNCKEPNKASTRICTNCKWVLSYESHAGMAQEAENIKKQFEDLKKDIDSKITVAVNNARLEDWIKENEPEKIEQLIWQFMTPDPEDGSLPCSEEEFERRNRDFPELLQAAKKLSAQRLAAAETNQVLM